MSRTTKLHRWLRGKIAMMACISFGLFFLEQALRSVRCHGFITHCFFYDKWSSGTENVLFYGYEILLGVIIWLGIATVREQRTRPSEQEDL